MSGITKITKVADLGNTPAKVNRITGEMFISMKHFNKMNPTQRKFVLFHEEGHAILNTTSEEAADNYAVDQLLKRGYPLTQILKSLTNVLTYNNPEHHGRTLVVFNKLREYDYKVNGNTKVITNLKTEKMETPTIDVYNEQYNYESNAIGVIIGAAQAGASAYGAGKTLLGKLKGSSGGAPNMAALFAAEYNKATTQEKKQQIIDLARAKGVTLSVEMIANDTNPTGSAQAGTATGTGTRFNDGTPTFLEQHKTKIIVAVVVVVVVLVVVLYLKKKKAK